MMIYSFSLLTSVYVGFRVADMDNTTVLAEHILTEHGYQSVGAIVAQMQADGTKQIYIDRWLQGLETGRRVRSGR